MVDTKKIWPHPEGTSHAEAALGSERGSSERSETIRGESARAEPSQARMSSEEVVRKLSDLAQLDIDAFHAYGQAISSIDDPDVKSHMERYQSDHEHHYTELSRIIREHGGTPPEFSRDFKGYLIEGFTSLRSSSGTYGALKAMKTNEEMTNRRYSEASRDTRFPGEIMPILDRFYGDEKTHLSYIEQTLGRMS